MEPLMHCCIQDLVEKIDEQCSSSHEATVNIYLLIQSVALASITFNFSFSVVDKFPKDRVINCLYIYHPGCHWRDSIWRFFQDCQAWQSSSPSKDKSRTKKAIHHKYCP